MLVLLAFLFVVGVSTPLCSSWHNCLKCQNGTIEVDMLAFLSVEDQSSALAYFENVHRAVELAKSFGPLHSDDQFFLHTTVQYLCCYSLDDVNKKVVPALRSVPWQPFNVSFAEVVCNYDNATNWG
jgi:hypothetical protein